MASHNHRVIEDQVLYDDCPRCDQHVEQNGLGLDQENARVMWAKMLAQEGPTYAPHDQGSYAYQSRNERLLGRHLYETTLLLERNTMLGYSAWWVTHPSFDYAYIVAREIRSPHYREFGEVMARHGSLPPAPQQRREL